jgi:hypothetical protein
MPRRTRRQLVGKQEDDEQVARERQVVLLSQTLRRQRPAKKGVAVGE